MRLFRKVSKILYLMTYTKNEFTNEPKHILQHKALLAKRIINLILGQDMKTRKALNPSFYQTNSQNSQTTNPSDVSGANSAQIRGQNMINKSLRESILDQISSYQSDNQENPFINESVKIAKNQLINVFSSGVYVPQYLCIQSRFSEEIQSLPQIIDRNQHIEDSRLRFSEHLEESYKKLAFCPTYLITRQIFKKIVIEKNYCLLTGVSGVGKTYSFILYKILSEMVFQYLHFMRLKALDEQISRQFKQSPYLIPKVAFWCIDEERINKNKIEKNIISQLYQVKNVISTTSLPRLFLQQSLYDTYYQKFRIRLFMLVDQLHTLASIKRRLIYTNQKQEQKKSSQIESQIEMMQFKLKQLKKIISSIVYHFQIIFYLSSVQIQRQILQSFSLLPFPKHSPLPIKQLQYLQKSNTQEYDLDFISFIIFNFQRKFLEDNLERFGTKQLNQNQSDALNFFRSYLRENNVLDQFYVGFLQNLTKKMQSLTANEIMISYKQNKVPQQISNIIQQAEYLSENDFYKRITHFLKASGNENLAKIRKLLMLNLLLMAKKEKNFEKQDQRQKDNGQAYKNIIINFQHGFGDTIKTPQESISNLLFQKLPKNRYRCLIPKKILIKVLESFEFSLYESLLFFNNPILQLIGGRAFEGGFLQNIVTKALSIQGTMFKMKNVSKNIPLTPISQQQNMKLQPKEIKWTHHYTQFQNLSEETMFFEPIPKINQNRYNEYSFLKCFQNYFNLMDKHNQGQILIKSKIFLPILQKQKSNYDQIFQKGMQRSYLDEQSKLIDFIIVPKSILELKLKIYAFDVTAGQHTKIQSKLCHFLKQFVHFTDRFSTQLNTRAHYFNNIQLQYYVLVPKIQNTIDWQKIVSQSKTLIEKQIKKFKNKVESLNQSIKNEEESIKLNKSANKKTQQKETKEKNLERLYAKLSKAKSLLSKSEQALLIFDQIYFDGFKNFCKLSRKTEKQLQRNKILLKKIGIVSLLDETEIINTQNQKIETYKRLLEKYRKN